jgi:hypothetical protein
MAKVPGNSSLSRVSIHHVHVHQVDAVAQPAERDKVFPRQYFIHRPYIRVEIQILNVRQLGVF